MSQRRKSYGRSSTGRTATDSVYSESPTNVSKANFRARIDEMGELTWNADTIGSILHNPQYKGLNIYGRTRTIHHPRTGKKKTFFARRASGQLLSALIWKLFRRNNGIASSESSPDAMPFGLPHAGAVARRNNATDNPPLFSGLLKCGACEGGRSLLLAIGTATESFSAVNIVVGVTARTRLELLSRPLKKSPGP